MSGPGNSRRAAQPAASAELQPDWAIHPGVLLARYLKEHGIRQAELAERTGLTAKHVNQIIKKSVSISPDVAVLLETALGTPPRFWANVGADWDMHLSEQKAKRNLQTFASWVAGFDMPTLVRHGIVSANDALTVRAEKVLRFFGVATPAAFDDTWVKPRVSFKRSQAYTVHSQNTALWLRLVEHCAQGIETKAYKPAALRKAASKIPAYTTMPFVAGFEAAQAALADAGVALVFVRQVPGTRVCAATWWLGDQPAIGITERHRRPDIFWFSALHEIGHLLRHPRRTTFLDIENERGAKGEDDLEKEADEYAESVLFPGDVKNRIAAARTRGDLLAIAADLRLGVAVVAGRHGKVTDNWRIGGSLRAPFTDDDIAELEGLCTMPSIEN